MRPVAFVVLLIASLAPGLAWAAPPRFAIVIGNNRPERASETTLHYADDDALATHRLLVDAGVESVLLTTFDADTARQAGDAKPRGPATWQMLTDALATLAITSHPHAELFVFYSGHGDVAHGEGYVMLEDRRLTRRMLYQLLASSGAERNHVIVDACKSYFLAFARGPGGERATYAHAFDDAELPSSLANTGFVLSTSSDRESHEWDRFGAGVFSHEVRSALRGAADLDGDGHISYAELGAFLATANHAIGNPRFRPDFAVRPPGRAIDAELIAWPSDAGLRIRAPLGHIYVESASGERILDGHAAPGQQLALWLPAARPLFLRRSDESVEYPIVAVHARFDELVATPPRASPRGALHLAFESLFSEPFGPASLAAFAARYSDGERRLMAERAREHSRRMTRLAVGATAAALLTLSVVLSAVTIERYTTGLHATQLHRIEINRTLDALTPALAASLVGTASIGGTWLGLTLRWR